MADAFVPIPGPKGDPGPAGADGTSVQLKGSVADFASLPGGAAQGDLWITLDTGDGWVSDGVGGWTDVGPIQGPKGDPGQAGADGAPGQDGADGADGTSFRLLGSVADFASLPGGAAVGDTWITTDTGHGWTSDGAGGWTDVGELRGPQGLPGADGAPGQDGAPGPQGDPGPTGPTGPAGADGANAVVLSGAGAPGVSTGNGNPIGTEYIDTTADQAYILADSTADANVWSTGSGGQVDVIQPGSQIAVDATDPANPVVSLAPNQTLHAGVLLYDGSGNPISLDGGATVGLPLVTNGDSSPPAFQKLSPSTALNQLTVEQLQGLLSNGKLVSTRVSEFIESRFPIRAPEYDKASIIFEHDATATTFPKEKGRMLLDSLAVSKLTTTTGVVSVNSAAPSAGDVLTATSPTTAIWQPGGGGGSYGVGSWRFATGAVSSGFFGADQANKSTTGTLTLHFTAKEGATFGTIATFKKAFRPGSVIGLWNVADPTDNALFEVTNVSGTTNGILTVSPIGTFGTDAWTDTAEYAIGYAHAAGATTYREFNATETPTTTLDYWPFVFNGFPAGDYRCKCSFNVDSLTGTLTITLRSPVATIKRTWTITTTGPFDCEAVITIGSATPIVFGNILDAGGSCSLSDVDVTVKEAVPTSWV